MTRQEKDRIIESLAVLVSEGKTRLTADDARFVLRTYDRLVKPNGES